MNSATVQSDDNNAGYARALYILAVAFFPVLLAGFITLVVFVTGAVQRGDGIGHSTQFAQFDYPIPGELVSDRFELRGTIKSIPQGSTVYLAEMSEGRYWPKKALGDAPKSFTRNQVTNAGKGYKYTIVLLAVGAAGEAEIESWFDHGRKTGKYPGIASFEDSTTLAKIRIIRQ